MAISNTASRNTYTLDNVTTSFDITFDVVLDDNGDAKELEVWLIDEDGNRTEVEKGYASDQYTVSYKTVTYLDATTHAGDTLLITRATPRTQETDFVNNGAYNLNQVEAMSDKLTRIVQEQDATIADRILTSEEYAEAAAESAANALASEQKAHDWADKAPDVEVETGEYSAKHWASKASQSSGSAAVSAYDASVYAGQASSARGQSASYALESEGFAKGTQGGVPVSSDSPYYHDNSKYYYELITQIISGAMRYQGVWTTTSQTDYSSISTPRLKGDLFYCQGTATTIDGVTYTQGDLIIFNQDVDDGDTITTAMIDHVDNTETVTPDNLCTLTNKTIDASNNTILCTATSITSSQTLTPTKQMMLTLDTASITLTLGSGPYVGYSIPMLSNVTCDVSYTGEDGATTDELNAGDYITYVWQGSYWIVDASTYTKPTYISTSQTITPTKQMILVIDTASVVLTLGNGLFDGFEISVLAQATSSIVYESVNGSVTESRIAGDYSKFTWNGTYWIPSQTTPITGIDDNGNPFAFNVDTMVHYDGLINVTGTDANGTPFDYGVGHLVTNADEDNYSTSEVKTTKKWIDGKPIYRKVITDTMPSTVNTSKSVTTNIADADELIDFSSIITSSASCVKGNFYYAAANSACVYFSSSLDTLYLQTTASGLVSTSVKVIVYYTKTTD